MTDLIERFATEYHDYHGISPARRVDQVRTLRLFEEHAGKPLELVESQDLSRWFQALISEGLAPTTVRKYRGQLSSFFRWAWENKVIDAERYMQVRAVRLPRGAVNIGTPNPYTRREVEKLWADVASAYPWAREKGKRLSVDEQIQRADYYLARWRNGTSSFRRVRAYANRLQIDAVIAMCLCGGLRRDECYTAGLDDVDPENAYMVVRSAPKNTHAISVPREVPWTTPYLRTAVGRWLAFRAELAPPHDAMWLVLWGREPLVAMRHRRFEMLLTTLGRGWEFRRLRHTAATEMLRAGYPLHEVQRILGHARLQQTLAYAQLLPDDVVRTAARHTETLSRALLPSPDAPTGAA